MFTIDISVEFLSKLLEETKAAGGDALRFEVYDDTDEVPPSFSITGLLRPSTELEAGQASIFPVDRV